MTTRVSSVVSSSTAASTPVSQAKSEARLSELHQPVEDDDDIYHNSASASGVTDDIVMQTLWGAQTSVSTSTLEYVHGHATRMLARVLSEDPHSAYIALRSKLTDVRLFKVATLVAETPLEHERCDFRGVTRVPGSIDTVMEMLASEDERESYWVALNTQRGLLVNSLFATRRLDGAAPFPRWNQRYTAVKFSKQSPPVECCFSEYAAFLATNAETPETEPLAALAGKRARLASQDTMSLDGTPLRRAFVYRRSMDQRLFDMEDVQEKLSKYGETCERLYLQDFLLEVSETSEKHICKVVLTCSVYITDNARAKQSSGNQQSDEKYSKSMRHEFRESCATMLQNLRQVLSNQWRDHMASSGVVAAPSAASVFSRSLGRRSGSQPAFCGVCSTGFSLLKKRNVCHACNLVVCSRCCTKQERGSMLHLGSQRQASTHDLNRRRATKECILCSQFGADSAGARMSVSIRRHFTSSTFNSQRSMTAMLSEQDEQSDALSETLSESGRDEEEEEDDEEEEVKVINSVEELDDPMDCEQAAGESQSTQPASSSPIKRNLRVRASTEDNTITSAWRESDTELPPLATPTRPRFKQRCESVNLPSPAPRAQGIVLLTDIDTLSLTGSFHRLSTTSSSGTGRGRLDSNNSDSSSRSFVRASASPPLPPSRVHRPVRSGSEDATVLLPKDFKLDTIGGSSSRRGSVVAEDESNDNELSNNDCKPKDNNDNQESAETPNDADELDDLANFNLKML